jgi:hypothetical protein
MATKNMHVTEFGAIEVLMNIVRVSSLRAAGWHSDDLTSWGLIASYAVSATVAMSIFHTIKKLLVSRSGNGASSAAMATNTMTVTEYGTVSILMNAVRTWLLRAAGWRPDDLTSWGSCASYLVCAAVAMSIYQAMRWLLTSRQRDGISSSQITT